MMIFFFLFRANTESRDGEERVWDRERSENKRTRSTPTNVLNGFLETILSLINRCQQHMCIYTHFAMTIFYCEPKKKANTERSESKRSKSKIKKQPTPTTAGQKYRKNNK